MSTLSYIGILAGICSLCGYIPYAKQIVEGKEHPERAAWLIWTLSNTLIFLSYVTLGARTTIWVPLAYLIGSAFITLLSFFYGKHGWGFIEKITLVGSTLASIRWVYSDKPIMTLFFNLAIGMTGYVRIIKRLILDKTAQEDLSGWSLYFTGAAFNLLAVALVQDWSPTISVLPIALVIMNGLVFVFAIRNRLYQKKNASHPTESSNG